MEVQQAATDAGAGEREPRPASQRISSGSAPVQAARPGLLARLTGENMIWRLIGLAVGALIWEVYARTADNLLIPSFTVTITSAVRLGGNAEIWDALYVSNQAMVLGFGFAVLIGLPLGLALGRFPTVARFTNPYVNILLVSPTAALIPLLIMSTGIGLTSRVILVTLIAVPYLIVNARAGIRQVSPSLIEMAKGFQASELKLWFKILIPAAFPQIMTGLRITLGRAIEGMIVVELIMVSVGIGKLVLTYQAIFEPELLYAVVVYVVIESVLLAYLFRWIERRATPWARRGARQ